MTPKELLVEGMSRLRPATCAAAMVASSQLLVKLLRCADHHYVRPINMSAAMDRIAGSAVCVPTLHLSVKDGDL